MPTDMRSTSLAATALVVTVVTVVLLIALTLNGTAAARQEVTGTKGNIAPVDLNAPTAQVPITGTSFGLFAANILLVVGAVGGFWFGVQKGIGYLGQTGKLSSIDFVSISSTSCQASINNAVSPGLLLGGGVNEQPYAQETQPTTNEKASALPYSMNCP